jgi:hypothetical protein
MGLRLVLRLRFGSPRERNGQEEDAPFVRCDGVGRLGAEGEKFANVEVVMGASRGEPDRSMEDLDRDGAWCVVLGQGFSRSQGDHVHAEGTVLHQGAAASAVGLLTLGAGDALSLRLKVELQGLAREGAIDGRHGLDSG